MFSMNLSKNTIHVFIVLYRIAVQWYTRPWESTNFDVHCIHKVLKKSKTTLK